MTDTKTIRVVNPTEKIVNLWGNGAHGFYVFKPNQEREIPEKLIDSARRGGLRVANALTKAMPLFTKKEETKVIKEKKDEGTTSDR